MATQQKRDYFGEKLSSAERAEQKRLREEKQALDNKRLGLLVFQISWMMAFVALIVVNWQLRFQYASWPPPNVEAMGVLLPTLATAALFISVLLARGARKLIEQDQLGAFTNRWRIVIGLGGIFVIMMLVEWFHVGTVDVEDTQYQAVFRLMTGFHTLHAIAIGAFMINILRNIRHADAVDNGRLPDDGQVTHYGSENFWAIEAASKMWDFVFIAWILFYVVLYWWRS